MNTSARGIGTHTWFFRDGAAYTVPGAGTASRTAKPGATDPAYIDTGVITGFKVDPTKGASVEIWAPTPGKLRLWDEIELKAGMQLDFTFEEMSPLAFELIFGTLALTAASTQYNPLEGAAMKKGWLHVQQYDQNDALFNTCDFFVSLKVSGQIDFTSDSKNVVVPVRAAVLHSTLNSGTLA
jgi:hypothetical protein